MHKTLHRRQRACDLSPERYPFTPNLAALHDPSVLICVISVLSVVLKLYLDTLLAPLQPKRYIAHNITRFANSMRTSGSETRRGAATVGTLHPGNLLRVGVHPASVDGSIPCEMREF